MRTEVFIDLLAKEAKAVRRLQSPARRMMTWLVPSLVYLAGITALIGPRSDIMELIARPRFVVELGAALTTGVLAAMAAFCSESPGRAVWERFMPLPALVVWLAMLGNGCWQSWLRLGARGLELHPELDCLPIIVGLGLFPAVLVLWMIRKGAPIAPAATTALAILAAAAFGAVVLRIVHHQDSSVMVLVWQFGSVALITALGALSGRKFMRWPERG